MPSSKLAVLLGALFVSVGAIAQGVPADAPPPPRPEAGLVPPPPPPPPASNEATGVASARITGVIKRYLINPEGDVDGLLLSDDSLVQFPPFLGTQLVTAAAPGERVSILGERVGDGTVRAQQITIAKTGGTLADVAPSAPPAPRVPPAAGLVELDVRGTVARVTSAPRGEPDGVLLADGTIVKLTPPAAARFANLLRPGVVVAAKGYGTRNRHGAALQATAFGAPGSLTSVYDAPPR